MAGVFVRKTGDWKVLQDMMQRVSRPRLNAAQKRALLQEAHMLRRKVVEAFDTSGRSNGKAWEPNKPSVRQSKGSSKPLVDTGDLRNSVQVIDRGGGWAVYVGVPNNAKTKDGQSLASIANVHEFGKTIAILITEKMHRYVMAKLSELGLSGGSGGGGKFRPGEILVINLPTRSFIRATIDAHFQRAVVGERLLARTAVLLGGRWRDAVTGRFVKME